MNQFVLPIKIYIEDTDCSGIVYHSNYLRFFERARAEWIESLGMSIGKLWGEGIYFVIRSAKTEYMRAAKLGDQLEIVTRVSEIKRVSMIFQQEARMMHSPETILCTAEIKVVCTDASLKPRAYPRCPLHDIFTGETA